MDVVRIPLYSPKEIILKNDSYLHVKIGYF